MKEKLGMGTWQLAGAHFVNGKPVAWGEMPKSKAIEMVLFAIESGIRFFDTADSYGGGISESILGEALEQVKIDHLLICTKFGNTYDEHQNPIQDFSPEYLKTAVQKSVDRLKRPMDFLLFHSPPDNFDWTEYDTTIIEDLRKQGLVTSYGVSSKSVYGAKKVLDSGFGHAIQIIYNVLDRRAEELIFNHSSAAKYQFINRVPLASGFLDQKFIEGTKAFKPDDYRSQMSEKDIQWFVESGKKLSFLNSLPQGISSAALRFCLQNPLVNYVIPGARSLGQIQRNMEAAEMGPLDISVLQKIAEAIQDVPEWWKPKI